MKAFEFTATIKDHQINVPIQKEQTLEGKKVRVIVLVEEDQEGKYFKQLAQDSFLNGYDESDSVYDNYSYS